MKSDNHSGRITTASLLVTLGIIYGDIGTSPLYVLKAIVGDRQITETLVLGGVSCIFWTLVLQTTIKYIVITLMADNEGEGGIFSLMRWFEDLEGTGDSNYFLCNNSIG